MYYRIVLFIVWAGLILMKLAEVPAIVGISWWIIAPLPIYAGLISFVVMGIVLALAAFGLSGYQKVKDKKPFHYPRG